MLHVPVPPLPWLAPVRDSDSPAHTAASSGDLVAVGASGSVTVVTLTAAVVASHLRLTVCRLITSTYNTYLP